MQRRSSRVSIQAYGANNQDTQMAMQRKGHFGAFLPLRRERPLQVATRSWFPLFCVRHVWPCTMGGEAPSVCCACLPPHIHPRSYRALHSTLHTSSQISSSSQRIYLRRSDSCRATPFTSVVRVLWLTLHHAYRYPCSIVFSSGIPGSVSYKQSTFYVHSPLIA